MTMNPHYQQSVPGGVQLLPEQLQLYYQDELSNVIAGRFSQQLRPVDGRYPMQTLRQKNSEKATKFIFKGIKLFLWLPGVLGAILTLAVIKGLMYGLDTISQGPQFWQTMVMIFLLSFIPAGIGLGFYLPLGIFYKLRPSTLYINSVGFETKPPIGKGFAARWVDVVGFQVVSSKAGEFVGFNYQPYVAAPVDTRKAAQQDIPSHGKLESTKEYDVYELTNLLNAYQVFYTAM
ncbi:MAG: hypothetical protein Q4A82_01460 [Corynebacterium sp.]|nr:hypothetical protein [Corynebacterium sp.]